jgi:hypothetical protein
MGVEISYSLLFKIGQYIVKPGKRAICYAWWAVIQTQYLLLPSLLNSQNVLLLPKEELQQRELIDLV